MPIVERLARLQEPDLPEKGGAIPATSRKSGAAFSSLTVECPFYRALCRYVVMDRLERHDAYLLMGTLMAGEWLLRRQVRKEIAHEADLTACTLADCATSDDTPIAWLDESFWTLGDLRTMSRNLSAACSNSRVNAGRLL